VLTQLRMVAPWVALALAIAPEPVAAAPRLLCYPIAPGDTVTMISRRLTRNPQGWRSAGFQILDPAAARFVPKENYGYLHPRWQACVVEQPVRQPGPARGWWVLVLLSTAALTGLFVAQWSIERRNARALVLQKFGAAFIREFERPLIDQRRPSSGLRAQLAPSAGKSALEVLLAPIEGRRYPNLSDHRANVEYDVERVVRLLNDRRFICGPPRARGAWVAIPFRLKPGSHKEGGA
jgi:hypothetical protein